MAAYGEALTLLLRMHRVAAAAGDLWTDLPHLLRNAGDPHPDIAPSADPRAWPHVGPSRAMMFHSSHPDNLKG